MSACPECGVERPPLGDNVTAFHKHPCPRQSDRERINELKEALTLARYEINRVLDTPGGP